MLRKILLTFLFLYSLSFADIYKKGDIIKPFSLPDQFDKVHQVNSKDYNTIVMAFEKDLAVMFNDFLQTKGSSYLEETNTLFISDIHTMPSFVTNLFALPKMRKYGYPLLLMYEKNTLFPKKEEALTILELKNNKIENIVFIKDEKDISKILH